jgi:hypothetical protein
MFKSLTKILGLAVMVIGGSLGLWVYQYNFSADRKIQKLELEKQALKEVVERLSDEKRVAEVLVTDQQKINDQVQTTLLFVEYDKSGNSLAPRTFHVVGEQVHIDAMVIKFDRELVKQGDPLRGSSIALFTRLYGDRETPQAAQLIDQPGTIPAIYFSADPQIADAELSLWKEFWQLADSAELRQKRGVRVANGQGLWGPFKPDTLYTLTLESDGGLNMTSAPLKGIYREAIKLHTSDPTATPPAKAPQ